MNYEDLLKLLKTRRSIRKFKSDPLPDDYVEKILEAARWAPSGANSQPWEFIVVRDAKIRSRIVELFMEARKTSCEMEMTRPENERHPGVLRLDSPGFKDAPIYIITLGDPRVNESFPLNAVYEHSTQNYYSGLASAFLYMHLAATSLGLASQWVSTIANNFVEAQLRRLLGIPKQLKVYDLLAVGFPAGTPRPRLIRDLEEITHYDTYDTKKYRSDEEIQKFIEAIHKQA